MKKRSFYRAACLFLQLFLLTQMLLYGADSSVVPYLQMPQTLYVGDPGRLILTPAPSGQRDVALVLDIPEQLPRTEHIRVHRIELELRPDGPRILIDFSAYAPGTLEFPVIEIGAYRIRPEPVFISSILDDSNTLLSPAAAPLSAPGTRFLIYTVTMLFVLCVLVLLLFVRRILPFLKQRLEERRSHRAFRMFKRQLQRLNTRLDASMDCGVFLDELSAALRLYLSRRLDPAFFSMTAAEIASSRYLKACPGLGQAFSGFFKRSDLFRFGTRQADFAELQSLASAACSAAESLELCLSRPDPESGADKQRSNSPRQECEPVSLPGRELSS